MIDALHTQEVPISAELRAYAKRQIGCRALMKHYGIGPLTAVTILAELGDARRFSSSRHAVRYAGLDITVHQSTPTPRARPPLAPRTAGAALGAVRSGPDRPEDRQPRPRLLPAGQRANRRQPRLPRAGTQAAQALPPHAARARRRRAAADLITTSVCAQSSITPMRRGRLPAFCCRHDHVDGPERLSGHNAYRGITPSTITSPTARRSRTEISPGARAHDQRPYERAHAPPPRRRHRTSTPTTRCALERSTPAQISRSAARAV
jgi:hypothetical protein